jgi:hypothetical protein
MFDERLELGEFIQYTTMKISHSLRYKRVKEGEVGGRYRDNCKAVAACPAAAPDPREQIRIHRGVWNIVPLNFIIPV